MQASRKRAAAEEDESEVELKRWKADKHSAGNMVNAALEAAEAERRRVAVEKTALQTLFDAKLSGVTEWAASFIQAHLTRYEEELATLAREAAASSDDLNAALCKHAYAFTVTPHERWVTDRKTDKTVELSIVQDVVHGIKKIVGANVDATSVQRAHVVECFERRRDALVATLKSRGFHVDVRACYVISAGQVINFHADPAAVARVKTRDVVEKIPGTTGVVEATIVGFL